LVRLLFDAVLQYSFFADIGNRSIPLRKSCNNSSHKPKPFHLLLQLNSAIRPGLSQRDFRALFAKCICGLIMTRRAFRSHYCTTAEETDVIEIADSESDVAEETDVIEITDSESDVE
jgi:hypothetical protein